MNNHQGLHTGFALRSNRRTGPLLSAQWLFPCEVLLPSIAVDGDRRQELVSPLFVSQRSASSSQSPVRSVSSRCQRVLDFKRTAALLPRSGTGFAEAETGQAEPDWPALADWLPNVPKVPFSREFVRS